MGNKKRIKGIGAAPDGRGQAIVEFMLILPILLLLVFMIIALGRLLHAWLAVENGARFAVRYAVTGEYEAAYYDDTICANFYATFGETCDTEDEKENAARVLSIRDAARAGSAAILRDETQNWDTPAFFKVTLCSTRANPGFVYHPSDTNEWSVDWSADCTPYHDAGGPGNRVVVTVDFNHPVIVPFLSTIAPWLHLTATREGRVEQFRVSRVVGIDPTLVLPSPTPLPTNTPTNTFTPLPTATASDTPTPSDTPTATMTPTATSTPTCSGVTWGSWIFQNGNLLDVGVRNTTYPGLRLVGVTIYWDAIEQTRATYGWNPVIDWVAWRGIHIRDSNDTTSSTSANGGMREVPVSPSDSVIRVDWDGMPLFRLDQSPLNLSTNNIGVSVTFDDATCNLSSSGSSPPLPSVTPSFTPTLTFTPSNTPLPSSTPLPSNTPTNTSTPSITPTASNTPIPTQTPTASNTIPPTIALPTQTPSITPVPSNTPTPTATDPVCMDC